MPLTDGGDDAWTVLLRGQPKEVNKDLEEVLDPVLYWNLGSSDVGYRAAVTVFEALKGGIDEIMYCRS